MWNPAMQMRWPGAGRDRFPQLSLEPRVSAACSRTAWGAGQAHPQGAACWGLGPGIAGLSEVPRQVLGAAEVGTHGYRARAPPPRKTSQAVMKGKAP